MRGADQDAGGPGAGRMRAGAAGAGPDARRSRMRGADQDAGGPGAGRGQ